MVAIAPKLEAQAQSVAAARVEVLLEEAPKYINCQKQLPQHQMNQIADQSTLQIVVEKLSKTINEEHLREIFGRYGTIRDLDLPISRQCRSFPDS